MAAAPKTIKLTSSDNVTLDVEIEIAKKSVTVKNMLDDLGEEDDQPIPLPNVTAEILRKVIAFCTQHKDDPEMSEEQYMEWKGLDITGWDAEFVNVDLKTLFELILAANFLDVKHMLDVTCKCLAHKIRGKTPDQIKEVFGITGDFTQEEIDQVKRDHEWLQEKAPEKQ